jgi:UDPglucose 6-dehydrogenase
VSTSVALPTVGFAGMTHLGLVSSVAGAERGFDMVCFDPDSALIDRIAAGTLPVVEPDLDALIARNRPRLAFTADARALRGCDVVYVAPDVATDEEGRSDLATIERLLAMAFDNTRADTVVVVLSQVPPGFTRSRQRAGRTLICQVETLIFGRAVERALHPERTIIGLEDAAQLLPPVYRTYLAAHGNPPLLPMRYESAELAKVSINCCLVASVSVANTLGELCEHLGADWSEIAPALKLDRRIGPYSYLTPGLGIAGGNLERDLATVLRLSAEFGTDAGVVDAWLASSRHRKNWAFDVLKAELLTHAAEPRIAVLGLTYKENTHSIKNSAAVALVRQLAACEVAVFDPIVKADIVPAARKASSMLDCIAGADAVAIMTPWPEFKSLDPASLAREMRGRLLLDPYGLLAGPAVAALGLDYFTLGAPPLRAERHRNA